MLHLLTHVVPEDGSSIAQSQNNHLMDHRSMRRKFYLKKKVKAT